MKAAKRRPGGGRRKGSTIPIERNPQRFEIAAWWAFVGMGCGQFDAARRALLAIKGGAFSVEDIEGVLRLASAKIPLPPHDPNEPDAELRRLSAKAKRQRPSKWLVHSSGMVRELIIHSANSNWADVCRALDELVALGWGPVILGLARRIEAALQSNLPPADPEKLSPAARRMLDEIRSGQKK